jgi:hypothetical protein
MIHLAEVELSDWHNESHRRLLGHAPMKKTIRYYCNTSAKFGKELWITTREGFSFCAESINFATPSLAAVKPGLLVVVTYELEGGVRRNLVEQFDEDHLQYSPELAHIKAQMELNLELPFGSLSGQATKFYNLLYVVPEDRLRVEGGHVYINQLDVVVSAQRPTRWDQLHPHHVMGGAADETLRLTQLGAALTQQSLAESDFIYTLSIVDNGDGDVIGSRYIDSGDGIIKITPRVDATKVSGIYASFRNPKDQPASEAKLKLMHSKDGLDIPWLTMHKTPTEAVEHRRNDEKTQARLRLAELEVKEVESKTRLEVASTALQRAQQDNQNLLRTIDLEQQKFTTLELSLKADREKWANQQKELEQQLEANARKYKQELNLVRLKNTGEVLKSGTVIAQGLIGIALLLMKTMK